MRAAPGLPNMVPAASDTCAGSVAHAPHAPRRQPIPATHDIYLMRIYRDGRRGVVVRKGWWRHVGDEGCDGMFCPVRIV